MNNYKTIWKDEHRKAFSVAKKMPENRRQAVRVLLLHLLETGAALGGNEATLIRAVAAD